jgi:site-specific DNA-methyltransferase (adenine-specific)
LDPFAGSGSTLVVAKKLGRRWVGYDVSDQYVRHAEARIRAVRVGDPIDGPEDPTASAPRTPFFGTGRREPTDEDGIAEAFRRSSQGYSVDRVIADPALNAAFVEACSLLKLSGRQRDWNLTLVALRKSSKLAEMPADKRTQISWEDMDPFAYAAEMALAEMLRIGYPSLDHILCDPPAATRFDDLARSLAPGFRPLDYRWAALRLRKDARLWREAAKDSHKLLEGKPLRVPLTEGPSTLLRAVPGVYCLIPVSKDPRIVYVGETSDLRRRAGSTWAARRAFDQLVPNSGKWELEVFELEGSDPNSRRGLQSLLIARDKPRMNFMELAGPNS